MADLSTRSLLLPDEHPKSHNAHVGRRHPYKLPLLILAFLFPLIGCIIASTVILLTSNGDLEEVWRIRPAVLLSTLASVYSVLLGGLFATGVTIIWWRSFRHSTSLRRLHFINAGANPKDFYPAIIAGGHARRVALAAFFVYTVKLATGPILQRSTSPGLEDVTNDLNMTVNIARTIRDGWFGDWNSTNGNGIRMGADTLYNMNITLANNKDTPSSTNSDWCPPNGTCEVRLAGAGLNFGCKNHTESIALLDEKSRGQTVFAIKLDLDNNTAGSPTLFLETKFISDISDECIGTIITTQCQIIPATMLYDVSITNNTMVVDWLATYKNPRIITNASSPADNLSNNNTDNVSGPLKGLLGVLQIYYQSEAVWTSPSRYGFPQDPSVFFWSDVFKASAPEQLPDSAPQVQECPMYWDSPTPYVMSQLIQFMFRSAVSVARRESGHEQTVLAQYKGSKLKYSTDYGWFAAALVIQILGVAAAMSLLWGFWQLNHYVTLSPIETAKAFGAPVLTAAGPEQEVRSILKAVGHERVAYDGDELVWSGSLYATGVASSQRTKSSHGPKDHSMNELDTGPFIPPNIRGRGHRRGMSSVSSASASDASPSQTRRPSFEHSRGYTTRRPYDDEEEFDIGQYGVARPRSRSRGSENAPLIPEPLSISHGASPKLPPIQRTETLRMDAFGPSPPSVQSPSCGRMRRGSRCAADVAGVGRRPLSKIEERRTPEPMEEVRW